MYVYFGVAMHTCRAANYISERQPVYFGLAINIAEWQCILRSGNAYFGVARYILEWQCISRRGNAYRMTITCQSKHCKYLTNETVTMTEPNPSLILVIANLCHILICKIAY